MQYALMSYDLQRILAYMPHTPSRGSADRLPLLEGSGFAAPAVVPLWAFSLLARLRTVLPQDSCVKARPRGAHEEDGHRLLAASEGCMPRQAGLGAGGPRSPDLHVPGDRRRTRVPDEALAVAGGPCGGN